MRTLLLVILLMMITVSCSGCAWLLLGIGVARTIAVSQDTEELAKDASLEDALKVTYSVLNEMGWVYIQDISQGTIKASIEGADVKVHINQITPSAVMIKITVRRWMIPHLELAERISRAIDSQFGQTEKDQTWRLCMPKAFSQPVPEVEQGPQITFLPQVPS